MGVVVQIALKFACEYERQLNFVSVPVPVLYTEYDMNIYSGSENIGPPLSQFSNGRITVSLMSNCLNMAW